MAADDRCQWQMKGGRPHTKREMSANIVQRESAARWDAAPRELIVRAATDSDAAVGYSRYVSAT